MMRRLRLGLATAVWGTIGFVNMIRARLCGLCVLALLLFAGCADYWAVTKYHLFPFGVPWADHAGDPYPEPACPRPCPVGAELPPLPTTADVTLAECCTDARGATWSRCAWNAYGRCKPGKES